MSRALVIEGGGSKTAYAHGVMCEFEAAGYLPWKAVYGNSLGGALAAWHGAGQARYSVPTWDSMRDPRYLAYRRILIGKPPIDQDRFVDILYIKERPLDLAALAQAKHRIHVVVSDIESGQPLYPDIRKDEPLQWLKATMRLPLGSNGPVEVHGRKYLDGGCLDPIPIQKAIDDGFDDITLILNQPPGSVRREVGLLLERAVRRYPALEVGLRNHAGLKAGAWQLATHPPKGVKVHIIHPAAPTGVSRLSRDLKKIHATIALGRADGRSFLSRKKRRFV